MKLFSALGPFVHRRAPVASVPFDDGLVEFARLMDVNDPVKAVTLPAARLPASGQPRLVA